MHLKLKINKQTKALCHKYDQKFFMATINHNNDRSNNTTPFFTTLYLRASSNVFHIFFCPYIIVFGSIFFSAASFAFRYFFVTPFVIYAIRLWFWKGKKRCRKVGMRNLVPSAYLCIRVLCDIMQVCYKSIYKVSHIDRWIFYTGVFWI